VTAAPSIVWLRDDLRIADNPALRAGVDRAAAAGTGVIVLYLLDEVSPGIRALGGASRWWLHGSLTSLGEELEKRGSRLLLRRGAAETELPRLVRETGADAVFWNRRYGAGREVDARLKSSLRDAGVTAESFAANLLVEPWTVTTAEGNLYRVFTPFWRAAQERPVRELVAAPREIPAHTPRPEGDALDDWRLLPTRPDWAGGLREAWTPGEASAHHRLERFVTTGASGGGLADYHRRDEPAVDATSRLSPHLRFGELSPVQIWHRIQHGDLAPAARRNAPKFLSEVGWREFNWNILFHSPELATKNFRPEFDAFPWDQPSPDDLAAWQQGRTGIPLVDAGMRELWTTGVMHNRVRMVAASLLVKNLLVDWRVGEQWFWDTLVDADEASNPANWQWVAGSGADAAPYFRVFNPELQAAKFDPTGEYLDRWVPERLSPEYPPPIVDLAESRREALAAYEVVKASK
jgi:deoxyribodipyrimidine photo-lyase